MKKIRKGFTLIEMVIVLFIISLLLLIMIPNLVEQKNHASLQSDKAFRTTLITQAGLYVENKPKEDGGSQGETTASQKEKVTIKQLLDGKYITKNQLKKAQDMKIAEDANLLELTSD